MVGTSTKTDSTARGASRRSNPSSQSPPKLRKEDIEKLNKIFYNPDFGLRDATQLFNETKKKGLKLTFKQIKDGYYDNQEVVQMWKPISDTSKKESQKVLRKIDTAYPAEQLYMDTQFFYKYNIYLINALDLASRYAWVKPLFVKHALNDTKKTVTPAQTLKHLEDVTLFLNSRGYSVDRIITDSGNEFFSTFDKYCQERGIEHTFTYPNDHQETRPIDAFSRTMRILIEKFVTVHGTKGLITAIPKLVDAYNNQLVHSSLKMTPAEYLSSNKAQDDKEKAINESMKGVRKQSFKFNIGDSVRVLTRLIDNKFKKIKANWSREIYSVKKLGRRYTLSNGKEYTENELQLIPFPELVMRFVPYVPEETPRPSGRSLSTPEPPRGRVPEPPQVRKSLRNALRKASRTGET